VTQRALHTAGSNQSERNEMGGTCGRVGERRGTYRVRWVRLRERGPLEDLVIDGRMILKWTLRNRVGESTLD
jgi:hypothetical protein